MIWWWSFFLSTTVVLSKAKSLTVQNSIRAFSDAVRWFSGYWILSCYIMLYHVISCLNLEREGGLLKHLSVLRLHSFGQKRFSQNLIGRCSICWFVLIFMLIHTFIDFRLVFIWWYSFAAMLWCNPSTCRTSDIDDWHGLSNRKCFHLHPTSCITSSVQIGLCTGFKMVASRLVGICWIGNVDPTPD